MDESISVAHPEDATQLTLLINSAYRGDQAKKGWTHEANLIDGNLRTDDASLRQLMNDPNAVILKYSFAGKIDGCVYLLKKDSILYLGMLSVNPEIQARGIGKKLLHAAEVHAKKVGCSIIEMTVISVRTELIAWYQRQGYSTTPITLPFYDDGRFGKPKQKLEFLVLEKRI